MKVILKAPIFTQSGYGEHSRLVYDSLLEIIDKIDLYIYPLEWGQTSHVSPDESNTEYYTTIQELSDKVGHVANSFQGKIPTDFFDLSIQITIPGEFEQIAKYNVGITAGVETDSISHTWIQKINQMNKILTISDFSKKSIVDTIYPLQDQNGNPAGELKVQVPVEVVHYPVKEYETEQVDNLDIQTEFNFLSISLLGVRKNIENSLSWFVEKFHDNPDVGYVIKTSRAKTSNVDFQHTSRHLKNILDKYPDRKCSVYLLHGQLSEGQLKSLFEHEKIKCFISLAHGEGFGLSTFDAACSAMPVVATNWSGHLDYLMQYCEKKKKNKHFFHKVKVHMDKVQPQAHWADIIIPQSQWAYPIKLSYQQELEKVYKNYGVSKKRAKELKEIILKRHRKEDILKKYTDIIFEDMQDRLNWKKVIDEVEEI